MLTCRRDPRGYLPAALMALLFLAEAAWVRRGAAGPFDRAVRGAVHAWAMPALTRAMEAITMLGSHWVLVPLGALLVWRWAAGGRRREAMVSRRFAWRPNWRRRF